MTVEHPDWKPWWRQFAEFDGQAVLMADTWIGDAHHAHFADDVPQTGRFIVVLSDVPLSECRGCGARHHVSRPVRCVYDGNDEAEALAAFHEAEQRLLTEGR